MTLTYFCDLDTHLNNEFGIYSGRSLADDCSVSSYHCNHNSYASRDWQTPRFGLHLSRLRRLVPHGNMWSNSRRDVAMRSPCAHVDESTGSDTRQADRRHRRGSSLVAIQQASVAGVILTCPSLLILWTLCGRLLSLIIRCSGCCSHCNLGHCSRPIWHDCCRAAWCQQSRQSREKKTVVDRDYTINACHVKRTLSYLSHLVHASPKPPPSFAACAFLTAVRSVADNEQRAEVVSVRGLRAKIDSLAKELNLLFTTNSDKITIFKCSLLSCSVRTSPCLMN